MGQPVYKFTKAQLQLFQDTIGWKVEWLLNEGLDPEDVAGPAPDPFRMAHKILHEVVLPFLSLVGIEGEGDGK